MDNENIIDFGEWNLPKSWDELTLKQFQEIERYYADKEEKFDARDVLELFTDHKRDELDQLPIEFVDKLLQELSWLQETPNWGEPTNKVEIDGVTYLVNFKDKLKTGEYIATDTAIKGDKHNYAAILAILCRKEAEIFDAKFENEVLPSRIEMWEKQPLMKAMRVVCFFLELWLVLQKNSHLSSMVEEAISHTRKRIESLHKDGEISKRSMKSAMKKLTKLEKSIKCI